MYGAIIGDTVGSVYEFNNIKTKDFPLFQKDCYPTDDTYMTLAVAIACVKYVESEERDLREFRDILIREMHRLGHMYPNKGYGTHFKRWLEEESYEAYRSCGNGSAMRASPCGWVCGTLKETLALAEASADVTHNHPEGIKGAQATAAAVYLARKGYSKDYIRAYITDTFGYDLDRTCDEIRAVYGWGALCQDTVPEAIVAFLESTDFEDSIRNAISLGGDSDTLAAITCAIAEAYYGVPEELEAAGRAGT
jgi:ADP-ribosylglycohydrolase